MKQLSKTAITITRLFFILIILVLNTVCIAQKQNIVPAPINWGEIDESSFDKSVMDGFTESSTITLCKFGETYVTESHDYDIYTHTDVHVRFMVLNNDGVDRSNITIPFWTGKKEAEIRRSSGNKFCGNEDGDCVDNIEASVYNLEENGEITKSVINDDQIFTNDLSDLYGAGVVSLAVPNVKVGSIVEYRYSIVRKNTFVFKEWYFQSEYPCLHNEYRVSYPTGKSYALITKGLLRDSIDISESGLTFINPGGGLDKVQRYVLKDVPALKEEPQVMSMDNFLTRIIIQINEYHDKVRQANIKVISSWKQLAEKLDFAEKFGRQVNRSGGNFSNLDSLYDSNLDQMTIIKNCYNHIRNHFRCNNSWAIYANTNVRDAYQSGVGSSAEINLALAGLLKKAGFKPNMALVSTRDHGTINKLYPFLRQFNHVICVLNIDGENMFLDASFKQGNYNAPPAKIIGCEAFIVDKKNPEIVSITTDKRYEKFVMCSGSLIGDTLVGKLQFKYKGYAAALERLDILNYNDDYKFELVNNREDIELTNEKIVNLEDVDKPLLTQFDYSMIPENFSTDNLLYINPFSVYGSFKNEFKSQDRSFPVEFNYLVSVTFMYSIIIPDEYELLSVPENISQATADNSISTLIYYNQRGKILQIKTQLYINKLIFPANEYKYVSDMFKLWETKHDEVIVLKKKDE